MSLKRALGIALFFVPIIGAFFWGAIRHALLPVFLTALCVLIAFAWAWAVERLIWSK